MTAATARCRSLCLLPLIALLFSASALAGTFPAFGPRTFTRTTTAPAVERVSFPAFDPAAPYELRVANQTVSSAVISLNGTEIFGTNDFNQQVTTLQKAVTLSAGNELAVELRGAPEESLTITILGIDEVAPTIVAVTSPLPNAAGWNSADVTVTFNCTDRTSGIESCTGPVTISTEGAAQLIQGTTRDRAGNLASTSVMISLDKTPPTLELTAPRAGSVLGSSPVIITGTVTDAISSVGSVACNDLPGIVQGGQFSCSVPLSEGDNSVRIVATDSAERGASLISQYRLVSTPTIDLTEPLNLAFLNISPITVRGTVSDPNAAVQVNGVSAVVSGAGIFSVTLPLVEGNNTLNAIARNTLGRVGTGSIQVTLDTTPPRVTINSPSDQFETPDSSIAVAGIVNDIVVGTVNDQQAQVTVNGVAAQVANRTWFVPQVPLAMGPNSIQVIARDRVGNSSTTGLTIHRIAAVQALIRTVAGNNQSGAIGQRLPLPLIASLADAQGLPATNRPVVFKVIEGNGTVSTGAAGAESVAVFTDAQGRAQTFFTLGTRAGAGNNKVDATATGFDGAAIFVASAEGTTAAKINVDSGLNQTGATLHELPFPFVTVVTDAGHNRLGGVPVTFTVTKGGGKFFNGQPTLTNLSDSDGRALAILTLGEEAGFENNVVEATFSGNTGLPAAFAASAKVPGAEVETRISGVVLNNSNVPIVGATLRLYQAHLGSASNIPVPVAPPVQSDAQGQFVIAPAPVGAFKLMADGSTVPGPLTYPTVEYDIVTVAGQNNTVGLPIYLPVLDSVNRLCVSETAGGTLTLPSVPGFSFTVAPGSATFPGGARSGCITVTPVHGDKVPMVPGFGQQPRFVVTIQPVGTVFNPPAQITLPNVDGLRPREVTEMYSYDHDLSAFVAIGTGTVSDDGSVLRSDPGVGVLKAGWHCGGNPNTTGSAATCPQCLKCQGSNCVADAAKAGAPCDDKKRCTQNDKCVSGGCVGDPVDVSDWTDDSSLSGSVNLPQGLVDAVNNGIQRVPGLGGVTFKKATLGVSGRTKNCCGEATGVIEGGIREGSGNFSLSADVKGITIYGSPTISREFDFTFVIVQVDFQFGVKVDGSFSLSASGGIRDDLCKGEDCFFGAITGGADVDIKATFEAILCVESFWTTKQCAGLTITPLGFKFPLGAGLQYNKPDCDSGLAGFFEFGKIVAHADFGIGVPSAGKITFSYEVFGGAKFTYP